MPDEPECTGLLAPSLATTARRDARLDNEGELILMADQERSRWYHHEIAEAVAMLDHAIHLCRPGPYQLQAAIACLHGLAPTFADTDWEQIASLYATLERVTPTPVVRVNRAIAVAEARGARAGLDLLDQLNQTTVDRWHLYWSTRGELLARVGQTDAALQAMERAIGCAPNDSDRRFLLRRRDALARERRHPT